MRNQAVGYAIARLMQILGAVLFAPLALAAWDYRTLEVHRMIAKPEVSGFLLSIVLCWAIGTALARLLRGEAEMQGPREGYAIVTLGWLIMTFWTCVPLWFYLAAQGPGGVYGSWDGFTSAYFEIMSGYTTTGATILADIESLPRSLLLLRAVSHWLGGMGIITLAIVIFPSLGVSAYSMFRGEVPGPSKDKLRPRLAQTASVLWGVYVLLTAAETALLWAGDMNLFEAVCHSFATMATGGFSTRNASVAAFNSDFIEWVIIVFMFLASLNVLLHFRALRGDLKFMTRDPEFRFFTAVVITAVVIATTVLYVKGLGPREVITDHYRDQFPTAEQFDRHYDEQAAEIGTLYDAFRTASFQVVSMVSTTGFCTADFGLWPDVVTFLLVLLMFFGGCAGSTGGGIKAVRILIVCRVAWSALKKMTQPRLVTPIRLGNQVLNEERVLTVVSFFILFIGLFILIAWLMTFFVPDLTTAVTSAIATFGNVGPGLAAVGAIENYGWIPIPGKWVLVFSMLLGRLEIFTVLIVCRPSVWRR